MVSSLVDTISIKYYFKHSFTKSHDTDIIQKKKSPHWGEYQFLSRLKSQVSLARYYETEKSLLSYTVKVLDALGFRYGPSHTELMLTPKGPRLIETAARPMGGFSLPI